MRNNLLLVAFATTLTLTGCHSSTQPNSAPITTTVTPTGRSIADMEAEYARLREAHEKKCLYATPPEIKANQAVCESERHAMAPLGNALYEAKLKEAQRQANP